MIRILASLFCAVIGFASPAAAMTNYVYSYTGNSYDIVENAPVWAPSGLGSSFSTAMGVTASIELTSQLAASQNTLVASWTYNALGLFTYQAHPSFVTATLSNGRSIFTLTDAPDGYFLPVVVGANPATAFYLSLITDTLGEIVQWAISAGTGGRYDFLYGSASSSNLAGATRDQGVAYRGPYTSSAATMAPGIWSMETVERTPVVPLPASALLLMSALAGLLFLRWPRRASSI